MTVLLHDLFDYFGRTRGHLCFAVDGARTIDYGEALGRANQFARAMTRAGLGRGDRLVYLGANSIEHALLYYAASKAGVVPVPLNPRLTADEIGFVLGDSGATAIVADEAFAPTCDAAARHRPQVTTRVAVGSAAPDGWIPFDEWLRGEPIDDPSGRGDPSDVLYQMYTSGTTGRPKGVLLTHRSVLTNCAQVSAGLGYGVDSGDRWLIVAPLFHAAAVITAFNCVAGGGCLVIHRGFDAAAVVRALSEDRISLTTLVPSMIHACLVTVPDVAERRYDTLRAIAYGGSTIAEPTLRRAIEVFGCDFYQGFGQTESSAGLTYLTELDHRRALDGRPDLLASCGRALPGTEVRIVDEDGTPLPCGAVGEIVARGPQLMDGYWNQPEETARALRGGWLWTGDAGSLDEEGYLTIRDRIRDMVVTGGENVYPREVEAALVEHPDVLEVAVIGVPDERWGEAVHAVVVTSHDCVVEEATLDAHCRERLAGFKVPRSYSFVDELPRNASGKVRKTELRRRCTAETGRDRG
jgi:acyl-CoA synthetase (AMP-forming)/AMP-acid ligase II